MSKNVNFTIPKGKSNADYHKKKMSHGTYRCKRKPNSPLCKGQN